MKKYLTNDELEKSLSIEDLTNNNQHAIGIITNEIISNLGSLYKIKPYIVRTSPIVSPIDNYNKLYYPTDTITLSSRYTRWISEDKILRTQMTSCIPNELQKIENDTLLICPGIVYRRDVVDKTHVGEPHQMDIWKLSNTEKYDRTDLLKMVGVVVDSILPNIKWRYNETKHYYTKDGIEVEVYINGDWLEILECGIALPKLLDDSGLDSNIWSGLAMGIGIDRSVMLRKGINDIRILRNSDDRISNQMKNLDVYKEISLQPQIKRDMSIAVDNEIDAEQLGDVIRQLMGDDINIIETVSIKGEWSYSELPEHVSKRLGMNESMKNILLSVIIRPIGKSMKREEANLIYNKLYNSLHEGDIGYYIM